MRKAKGLTSLLEKGGFAFHRKVGDILKVGFAGQCWLLSGLVAGVILAAGAWDRSFVLAGRDVGLFEHPAIWAFLGVQVALPLAIRRSLINLARARPQIRTITKGHVRPAGESVVRPVLQFVELEDPLSRTTAALFYGIGLVAFVWNTYQNQLPGVVVPYDFWDSKTYQAGFWVTRAYKLYLFAWLLPYIALIHVGVLATVLTQIRRSRIAGRLRLIPFHADDVGGLGFVPSLVTTPIVVALLLASVAMAAAFVVHRGPDVTPLMGLSIVIGGAFLAYGIPITMLRSDLVALKHQSMRSVRQLQQEYYDRIVGARNIAVESVRDGNDALEYFEKLANRIRSISNYPHLKRFAGYVGIAIAPSVLSMALDLYEKAAPIIGPLMQKP
jgi:hypothetical protein